MPTNRFELLVFDWDGTLVDSAGRIVECVRAAIEELSLNERDDDSIRHIIGLGLHEAVDYLYPGRDHAFHALFASHYRRHFLASDPEDLPLFEGAGEILEALRAQGYRLGVATGKSRAGLDRELRSKGLAEAFDTTRCADETASKPHPRMLLEVMASVGAAPERTLMVGDTTFDLEMARNAGADCVAVTYGAHPARRLLEFGPLACLGSLSELPALLHHGAARQSASDD